MKTRSLCRLDTRAEPYFCIKRYFEGEVATDMNGARNIERILLPTDFSEASEHALSYALSLAERYGAKLYVLHVVDTRDEAVGFYVPHLSFEKLDDAMKESAEAMLERFCSRLIKGVEDYEKTVLVGEPYEEIVRFARENKIDVIVMGTFGSGRVDKLFFGSTTERVVRRAGCPVFIIPPAAE